MNIESIKQIFEKITARADFYLDINYFSKSEMDIRLDNINTEISKDTDKGIKIRGWDGEKFIEGATTSLDEKELNQIYEEIKKQVNKNKEEIISPIELKVSKEQIKKVYTTKQDKPFDSLSLEEKTNQLREIRTLVQSFDKDIANVRIVLFEELEEHIFVNKYKTLHQKIPISVTACVAYVKCNDGLTRMVYESFVDNDLKVFHKLNNSFDKFKEQISRVKKAKKLKGGKYKVILSPRLSGLLAHESFGHGMEADTMMKDRALASEWQGKKIGESNINIIDYPAIEGKHGMFHFDHEGNIAKKTFLVKDGIINEPMADIYSKTTLNLENSSNGRFESFDHKHYTRMSNTYFEPGNENFEDMVKKIDDGILIIDSSGGMEDPKGWGVQVQGCFGQKIKNGKLVDEYYDGFALTGFLPDIIKNISGVSKEFEIEGGGNCGKGHKEWVRVSEGGPYLLINELILG